MSVISSCVWASKPISTKFAPARILGQHIWTREIILRKLGPTPFKNLPKNQFLIFINTLWAILMKFQNIGLGVFYDFLYNPSPKKELLKYFYEKLQVCAKI